MRIILATTSPYRKRAFAFLGISFEAKGSNIDESLHKRERPEELVALVSKLKAQAIALDARDSVVIGCDSVGYADGDIIEKPKSRKEAMERLSMLSGKNHDFFTGIFMINTNTGKTLSKVLKTKVSLRKINEKEIADYLDEGEYYKTYATGYSVEDHKSASFVKKINHFLLKVESFRRSGLFLRRLHLSAAYEQSSCAVKTDCR